MVGVGRGQGGGEQDRVGAVQVGGCCCGVSFGRAEVGPGGRGTDQCRQAECECGEEQCAAAGPVHGAGQFVPLGAEGPAQVAAHGLGEAGAACAGHRDILSGRVRGREPAGPGPGRRVNLSVVRGENSADVDPGGPRDRLGRPVGRWSRGIDRQPSASGRWARAVGLL
ncbi:hypothetical protein LK08_19550 [Streptomyces sp. MUSC 125]|nr:hypothetical protein LK08_19550 [Streptomyces sp. MUSC 125]